MVGAMVFGVLMSLATGFLENRPEIGIPEIQYYGYPLVWRVTQTLQQPYTTDLRFASLVIDIAFWVTISFLAFTILEKILKKISSSTEAAIATYESYPEGSRSLSVINFFSHFRS